MVYTYYLSYLPYNLLWKPCRLFRHKKQYLLHIEDSFDYYIFQVSAEFKYAGGYGREEHSYVRPEPHEGVLCQLCVVLFPDDVYSLFDQSIQHGSVYGSTSGSISLFWWDTPGGDL
jgi:hypothetical protein